MIVYNTPTLSLLALISSVSPKSIAAARVFSNPTIKQLQTNPQNILKQPQNNLKNNPQNTLKQPSNNLKNNPQNTLKITLKQPSEPQNNLKNNPQNTPKNNFQTTSKQSSNYLYFYIFTI